MSDILTKAVEGLNAKLDSAGFDGIAKFVLKGEGSIVIDANGARIGDDEADVTLTAEAETFRSILEGTINPTSAFMTGRLSVDGAMGMAMKLAALIA